MSSYADLDSLDLLDERSPLIVTPSLPQTSSESAAESHYPKVNQIHALRTAISDANRQNPALSPLALGQRGDETSPLAQREIEPLPSVSIPTSTPQNSSSSSSSVFTLASGAANHSSAEARASSNSPEERVARASIPVLKKKDPHATGYNLNLILLKELYAPADKRSYDKATGYIREMEQSYKKLDDCTRLTRMVRTLNKDHPSQINLMDRTEIKTLLEKAVKVSDQPEAKALLEKAMGDLDLTEVKTLLEKAMQISNQPEVKTLLEKAIDLTNKKIEMKALLEKAADLGVVEKGKTQFSDKEIEILLANLETECKILTNQANVKQAMIGPIRDQALQVTKIVQRGLELDQKLLENINQRMGR